MTEAPLIQAYIDNIDKHKGHRIASDPIGGKWCQDCDKFIGFPPIGDK